MYIIEFLSDDELRKLEFEDLLKEKIAKPFSIEIAISGVSSYLIGTSNKLEVDYLVKTFNEFLDKNEKEKLVIAEVTNIITIGWVKLFKDWIKRNM